MSIRRLCAPVALLLLLGAACTQAPPPPSPPAPPSPDAPEAKVALDTVSADRVKAHMSTLADDAMEGRGPGTPGYERALQYVETAAREMGLAPAGDNGSFRQRVPLRNGTVLADESRITVTGPSGRHELQYGVDALVGADHLRETVSLEDAPVVFVGYGVSAPMLGYDDYAVAGDVTGKVVAYLSGAPAKFPSNERAYFSSGAVKDAEAVKRGAIGTIRGSAGMSAWRPRRRAASRGSMPRGGPTAVMLRFGARSRSTTRAWRACSRARRSRSRRSSPTRLRARLRRCPCRRGCR
jgi:hypothetical protein